MIAEREIWNVKLLRVGCEDEEGERKEAAEEGARHLKCLAAGTPGLWYSI